jgi:hypothetical protein
MAGLVPAIHDFAVFAPQDVDARDIGERSDAVLRTAMRGHDELGGRYALTCCANSARRATIALLASGSASMMVKWLVPAISS